MHVLLVSVSSLLMGTITGSHLVYEWMSWLVIGGIITVMVLLLMLSGWILKDLKKSVTIQDH
jgi:hypothetical protein